MDSKGKRDKVGWKGMFEGIAFLALFPPFVVLRLPYPLLSLP